MRRAQLLLFVIACCHPAIAFVPTVSWKTLSRYGMGLQTGMAHGSPWAKPASVEELERACRRADRAAKHPRNAAA